jgi:hypothetical protein
VLALYIVAGIVLFIIGVLSIPVDMMLDIDSAGGEKAKMRMGWLFGLVWRDMRRRKKRKPEKVKKERRDIRPFLSLLRIRGLPTKALRLARQMLGLLKVKRLDADLRVGLDDPADTAMLWSVLWPALIPLNSYGPMIFRVEPAFGEAAFEVNVQGRVRLIPIQMVGPVLRFFVSREGWRLVRSMVVARWKRER